MASTTVAQDPTNGDIVIDEGTSEGSRKASPIHEEHQYLDLIRNILEHGEHRPDRY